MSSYANAKQLSVAAAVFDSSATGTYEPYAIQAVDNTHSGQVIPETAKPDQITAYCGCCIDEYLDSEEGQSKPD